MNNEMTDEGVSCIKLCAHVHIKTKLNSRKLIIDELRTCDAV